MSLGFKRLSVSANQTLPLHSSTTYSIKLFSKNLKA